MELFGVIYLSLYLDVIILLFEHSFVNYLDGNLQAQFYVLPNCGLVIPTEIPYASLSQSFLHRWFPSVNRDLLFEAAKPQFSCF